jgi:nucleoside-diphosphate-sugar epimerase
MDWRDRPVTVTGAAGFIGSHLTERLVRAGAKVQAMVHGDPRYRTGHLAELVAANPPNLTLLGGDLCDAGAVRKAVDGADTVFHLGAVTSVAYSYDYPAETIAVNTQGTVNVCAAAQAAGVRRLVHTSTAGSYGNAQGDRPITEDHPIVACNPYTAGKLGGDHVAETWRMSYGLPVTTVRLFNVYGPRMGRYLIMPQVMEQLLRGDDVRMGDTTPTRTFTYVDDIVAAFLAMAASDQAEGELVHFGSEESISMGELVHRIAAVLGREARIITDPAKLRPAQSEIFRVRVDSAKARRLLGWSPEVSLADGIERTLAWLRALSGAAIAVD